MTYSFHIVNSSINLYNQLKIKNIKGKEREIIIENTFSICISTFYNWLYLFNNLSKEDFKKYFIHKTHKCKITKEYIEYLLNLIFLFLKVVLEIFYKKMALLLKKYINKLIHILRKN